MRSTLGMNAMRGMSGMILYDKQAPGPALCLGEKKV